jgi:hypothetical protein
LLAVLMLALFYTHIVLFGFAFIGSCLLLWRGALRTWALNQTTFVPALAGSLYWTRASPAGQSTLVAITSILNQRTHAETHFEPIAKTVRQWPKWITDVLPGSLDVCLLLILCLLVIVAVPLSLRTKARPSEQESAYRCLSILPPAALAAAILLPEQHDWIWPIAGRFPYLFALFLPLLFAPMPIRARNLWASAVALLGLVHVGQNAIAFVAYDRNEVAGFEGALGTIPNGARVIGLIYSANSAFVGERPFMHYVAYVQAEKGGVVEYSFAETQQSPFCYVPPAGPPSVNLGYGWTPETAKVRQFSTYFEYVLSRGEHSHLSRVESYYQRIYKNNRWAVWKRRT